VSHLGGTIPRTLVWLPKVNFGSLPCLTFRPSNHFQAHSCSCEKQIFTSSRLSARLSSEQLSSHLTDFVKFCVGDVPQLVKLRTRISVATVHGRGLQSICMWQFFFFVILVHGPQNHNHCLRAPIPNHYAISHISLRPESTFFNQSIINFSSFRTMSVRLHQEI
jgi:hypothetical protein